MPEYTGGQSGHFCAFGRSRTKETAHFHGSTDKSSRLSIIYIHDIHFNIRMFIWCTIKVQQVNISKNSLGNYISIHLSIVFSKLGWYSMGLKFSNEKFSIDNHEFVCLMILNLIYILLMWKLYVKLKRTRLFVRAFVPCNIGILKLILNGFT